MRILRVSADAIKGSGPDENQDEIFQRINQTCGKSAPSWTMANVIISVLRSFLPLALIWLIKELIDIITKTTSSGRGTISDNILWLIIAVAVLWFLDEAASGLDTYVRKNNQ